MVLEDRYYDFGSLNVSQSTLAHACFSKNLAHQATRTGSTMKYAFFLGRTIAGHRCHHFIYMDILVIRLRPDGRVAHVPPSGGNAD